MQSRDAMRHQRDLPAIFQEVSALLSRQDLVTGLVGRQDTPRRELVQNLLQRQQSAELPQSLRRKSSLPENFDQVFVVNQDGELNCRRR